MIKKYLISIAIITIFALPCLAQTEPSTEDVFEDLGRESKPIGETIWQTVKTEFPKMIKRPWQDALTAWKMIFDPSGEKYPSPHFSKPISGKVTCRIFCSVAASYAGLNSSSP